MLKDPKEDFFQIVAPRIDPERLNQLGKDLGRFIKGIAEDCRRHEFRRFMSAKEYVRITQSDAENAQNIRYCDHDFGLLFRVSDDK